MGLDLYVVYAIGVFERRPMGFCSSFGDEFFRSVVVGVKIDAPIEPIFIKFFSISMLALVNTHFCNQQVVECHTIHEWGKPCYQLLNFCHNFRMVI